MGVMTEHLGLQALLAAGSLALTEGRNAEAARMPVLCRVHDSDIP